ncbi:MAG: M20 family metallopeptidase [Dehalococcoidia bacterium]|nr:M20 family metallopeptidase [Dehalococcoidia bacterium]MDH4367781.1 M20 family metallopeptidase [Dehalococcoidia bacterium]
MGTGKLKLQAKGSVESQRQQLIQLSLSIHDNPELGFKEEKASAWLASYLEDNGFDVERGIAGLPTAFRATYGQGSPRVALLAEYDALPKIGHGCGHNIIGVSAVGAGVASKHIIDQLGGSVVVLGTPGEEGFGGKIDMVKAGVFKEIDVAMIVHPDTRNMSTQEALACSSLEVEFFGRPAHAAGQPHKGINALDAMILAFTSINSLRQHIRGDARIHGIITDGGEAPNIVPAHSAAVFLIRALDNDYLSELKDRVLSCFTGASVATGAKLEYKWRDRTYAPMKNNMSLAGLFKQNLESLGRKVEAFDPRFGLGSTDMGNVSQVASSIHPAIAIASPEVLMHTPEFAAAAVSDAGHQGLIDSAKAMAMTVADILQPGTLDKIRQEFHRD